MPTRPLVGPGLLAVVLVAAPACGPGPAPPSGAIGTAGETTGPGTNTSTSTTADPDDTTTGTAVTGEPTGPTGTTGDPCAAFQDADLLDPIRIAVRNTAEVPLFLPFGPCGAPSPFMIEALSDGASWTTGGCRGTCEVQFCPDSCADNGSFMLAPGGGVAIFSWRGDLYAPRLLPAACWDGDEDLPCDVQRRAEPGDHRLTVRYAQELHGCDPDPCTCDLDGFDLCQVWNDGDPVYQFSTDLIFTMPTAGPIEIDLPL